MATRAGSTPLHRGTAGAKNVRDLFLKYPNVIAYVAGHTHANRIDLFRKGRHGLLADQHRLARRLAAAEPADRGHGQPRRHAVAVRHAARPGRAGRRAGAGHRRGGAHRRPARRASSRVLAWNDPQRQAPAPDALGRTLDRNVELLLRDPRE